MKRVRTNKHDVVQEVKQEYSRGSFTTKQAQPENLLQIEPFSPEATERLRADGYRNFLGA